MHQRVPDFEELPDIQNLYLIVRMSGCIDLQDLGNSSSWLPGKFFIRAMQRQVST